MKKGFTLMELLITIALLGVIGTVIVSNMSRTLDNEQQHQIDLFEKRLEKSACVYADINDNTVRGRLNNHSTTISINELLGAGLIKEEELVSPETQSNIKEDGYGGVKITYMGDGIKECCYDNNDDRCTYRP